MQASGIPDSVPLFLGEYNVDGGDYNDPANANMVGAVAAAATTYGMIHSNANFTMGALWDVQNDSAYSVFGHQGDYRIDPVGVVLADLTASMPGNMVQTTMPSNAPGLVGYATKSGAGFSVALIDTNLSQGYTVDLGKDGLPTGGLYRVEVSAVNPKGSKTALADLSHVSVAAGSVVIVTNEAPHGGTELNGTTSTALPSAPAGAAASGSLPTVASAGASGSGNGPGTSSTKPDLPSAASSGTAATPSGATTGSAAAAQPAASTGVAVTDPGSTGPSGGAAQAMAGAATTAPPSTSTGAGAGAAGTLGASTPVPANPNPTSPGGNPSPAPVGTGADMLVLNLSEDAYQGDARFELTVDGKAVGPVQSVTALHGKSQSEAFTFKGDWSGAHRFGVAFANDAWGGSAGLDRNLYVDSATFDGTQVEGAKALYSNGAVTFGTPASQPLPVGANSQVGSGGSTALPATDAGSGSPATPAPVGTGADMLVLDLSETAAQGDAQFTLTVDGKPAGVAQSVTASHGQGQSEAFTFKGDWGTGLHTVGVGFANPAAGSAADLARSLYLDSASYDGIPVQGSVQVMGSGPVAFALTPADMLAVTDNDGSSAAVPLIASGSHTDHPAGTSTVQQAAGGGTDTITTSGSVKGEALALGGGTRKLALVNPRAMVLTGGSGADTVTADSGANRFVAGSGSLDVTGGPGSAAYVLHAGGGALTVEDFDPGKGDTLAVDRAL